MSKWKTLYNLCKNDEKKVKVLENAKVNIDVAGEYQC